MTISELERESGVGRNTIYYYISDGLLPAAQKASATRAVYNRTHVELLQEIHRLKGEGMTLRQIREVLADRIEAAAENGVDLVAKQNEAAREAILQAAARRFAHHGYDNTRINDICKEVGVNAQLLYSHFPSKKHLFIACFEVYFKWMNVQVAGPIEEADDSATRLAWRVWAGLGLQSLSRDLQAMARVEALHPESDLRPLVRKVYEMILGGSDEELAADRKPGVNAGLFDDELVSYGFLGVLENTLMRTTWDDKYTSHDIMRNLLSMFLAVRAAYEGRVDLTKEWESISGLVDQLAAKIPGPDDMPGAT
ncbi:MAG: TetR family transcriptional regulator [Thermoleophilia bacterium]|nr:TetR family transcriptional regulator [Thermoleophilia bacterium]